MGHVGVLSAGLDAKSMLLKIQIKSQGQGKMNALLGEVQCRSQRFQKRTQKAVIRKLGHSGLPAGQRGGARALWWWW